MSGLTVAVTGATSDFGTVILPVLLDDPAIDHVVGLGRRSPRIRHPKLRSVSMDIRSPELETAFTGCDVVIHLAFVVEEQRDKTAIHEVNLEGSRNTVECAHRAGVRSMIIASSVSAYGREDLPVPVTEDEFPTADPSRYYFFDKAEVEHFAEWWLRRHPGEMTIAMLRPTYVVGTNFSNDGIDTLTGSVVAFPDPAQSRYQFIHENDLADAFHRAVHTPLNGPYNLGPRDWLGVKELGAMQGQVVLPIPLRLLRLVVDVAYTMRILPFSSHWISSGEAAVDSSAFERDTGWVPTMTSAEAAAVMVLLNGRPILARRHAPLRHHVCEAAVDGATRAVRTWGDVDPDMKPFAAELDRVVETCEHLQVPTPTGSVHIELHAGTDAAAPTVVMVMPRGLHARYASGLARTVADTGPTVALVDLPGHGLSTGMRGHAGRRAAAAAVMAAVRAVGRPGARVLVLNVPRTRTRRASARARLAVDTLAAVPRTDGLLSARSGPRLPARLRSDARLPTSEPLPYDVIRLPKRVRITSGRGQRRISDAILRATAP
ncbi:MAG: NAD-dependent epimerase/dehydratase family protein [Rhodococcus sp. (in: high G+C Gram-positive bacteria)]